MISGDTHVGKLAHCKWGDVLADGLPSCSCIAITIKQVQRSRDETTRAPAEARSVRLLTTVACLYDGVISEGRQ